MQDAGPALKDQSLVILGKNKRQNQVYTFCSTSWRWVGNNILLAHAGTERTHKLRPSRSPAATSSPLHGGLNNVCKHPNKWTRMHQLRDAKKIVISAELRVSQPWSVQLTALHVVNVSLLQHTPYQACDDVRDVRAGRHAGPGGHQDQDLESLLYRELKSIYIYICIYIYFFWDLLKTFTSQISGS